MQLSLNLQKAALPIVDRTLPQVTDPQRFTGHSVAVAKHQGNTNLNSHAISLDIYPSPNCVQGSVLEGKPDIWSS